MDSREKDARTLGNPKTGTNEARGTSQKKLLSGELQHRDYARCKGHRWTF